MDNATSSVTSTTPSNALPHSSNGNSEDAKRPKKVRLACERCRSRRIKCDGQTPACGNCAKSGSACIDVDGRNTDRKVSRGFVDDAVARIAWLEDIIRTQLPHVYLNSGLNPVEGSNGTSHWDDGGQPLTSREYLPPPSTSNLHIYDSSSRSDHSDVSHAGSQSTRRNRGLKRPIPSVHHPSQTSSVEQETRSVALNLGLLSLNSDSRQLHYLGPSSGSLLASLVQTGRGHNSDEDGLTTTTPVEIDEGPRTLPENNENLRSVQFDAMRTSITSLYAQLRKDLPPRKECNVLCNQFFSQLHPNHPFLHRSSFNWMVDALYKCAATQPPFLIQHNGWPEDVEPYNCNGEEHISNGRQLVPVPIHVAAFQVLLVLNIGALLRVRRRLYHHDPDTFFNSAMSLSNHVFSNISLPSLQAILLLLVHSLVGPSENDIWTFTHLSMAHCVDLGFHREIGDNLKFSKIAIEMRKRIFYSVYTFDRSISTIQGRPFSISDGEFDVTLPFMVANSINGIESPDSDQECMNYSIHLFKLARLVSRIKTIFYRLSTPTDGPPWPIDFVATQKQLSEDLNRWVSEVPSVVLFAPTELKLRLTMKLKIHYHGTMCLLHQPSQGIVQPNDQALQICYHHAAERLKLYETSYDSGNLVHSWRTVHDMFLAGATLLYCVWISTAVRESVSLPELASICRTFSSLLTVGGEWWPMIRKSRISLERLANHTIEMFSEKSRSTVSITGASGMSAFGADSGTSNENIEAAPPWLPEHIEEALSSVLNHDHDGHLSHIFETPGNTAFSLGITDPNDTLSNFDDAFWASFGNYIPNDNPG